MGSKSHRPRRANQSPGRAVAGELLRLATPLHQPLLAYFSKPPAGFGTTNNWRRSSFDGCDGSGTIDEIDVRGKFLCRQVGDLVLRGFVVAIDVEQEPL